MGSDVASDLDIVEKLRKGIHVTNFDEGAVHSFREGFDEINSSSQAPYVPIYIDSYGGDCYSLLAMVDIIRSSQKPVVTVALGKAMSCGAVLLSCGTKGYRFATQHCTIMLHDIFSWQAGKVHDIKAQTMETERLSQIFFGILDENCDKPSGYFEKFYKNNDRTDIYLSAEDSIKHGIIDTVGYPLLVPNVSMELLVPEFESQRDQKEKKAQRPKRSKTKRQKNN